MGGSLNVQVEAGPCTTRADRPGAYHHDSSGTGGHLSRRKYLLQTSSEGCAVTRWRARANRSRTSMV